MALSGLSLKPGSQKTLEADRKGSQKDSQGIKLPIRDPKKILVGHVIRLHGPQKPWPDKDILCFCTVSSRVAAHPGPFQFLGQEDPLRRDRLPTLSILGFPWWLSW